MPWIFTQVYFFGHQLHTLEAALERHSTCLQAYIVLLTNLLTSLLIAMLDKVCCRVHTWPGTE